MQNGIALGPSGQDDGYQSVVSDLVSLIEHVQASLKLIEQTMTAEALSVAQESAAGVVVLDDVSPRYVKAAAALKACDANLGIALHSLLDSRAPKSGASAYAPMPSVLSTLRM